MKPYQLIFRSDNCIKGVFPWVKEKDKWFYWKAYKTEKAALNAMKDLFKNNEWSLAGIRAFGGISFYSYDNVVNGER